MYVYFYYLHVSGNHVPIVRRINSYQCDTWYMSLSVDGRQVCRLQPAYLTVVHTECHTPVIALIQLTLLMMGTWLPEICTE